MSRRSSGKPNGMSAKRAAPDSRRPVEPAHIFEVVSNSPAALAGIKTNDQVVALDGQKVWSYWEIGRAEQAQTNQGAAPVEFTVRRGDAEFKYSLAAVKPISPTNMPPSFGILSFQADTNVAVKYTTPNRWSRSKASAGQIFATVGALFSKNDISVQQLGGAVADHPGLQNLFENEDGWRWCSGSACS